jgi:hypothetical protein
VNPKLMILDELGLQETKAAPKGPKGSGNQTEKEPGRENTGENSRTEAALGRRGRPG